MLTTNLILADYSVALGSFMLATGAALVVGKSVLVANAMALLRRCDRGPLIQPILFKTAFLLGHRIHRTAARTFYSLLADRAQSGQRVSAAHGFDLFLASLRRDPDLDTGSVPDLCHGDRTQSLVRHGERRRIFFTYRPSELQLNRRQRIRELVHLSKLADAHTLAKFRDPASVAHNQLVDIVRHLATKPRTSSIL